MIFAYTIFSILSSFSTQIHREEAIEVQKNDHFIAPLNVSLRDITFMPYIYNAFTKEPAANASLYLPMWQTYPLIPKGNTINGNFLYPGYMPNIDVLANDQEAILQAMLSPLEHLSWLKYLLSSEEYSAEPIGYMEYPILSNAADMIQIQSTSKVGENGNISSEHATISSSKNITYEGDILTSVNTTTVGKLSIIFSWRDLLQGILPKNIVGMIAVFDNACNQSFSYELVRIFWLVHDL
jgi:hypothetical protein